MDDSKHFSQVKRRSVRGMRTVAVHEGEPKPPIRDAISMPIFQSSTYLLGEPEEFDDIRYVRLNNTPNHEALAAKLAALEGTGSAVVTPSGTAAISAALLTHSRPGAHVIAPQRLYGGTRKLLDRLIEREGIEVSYVSYEAPETWSAALTPRTRVLYVEPLVNPLLRVPPLERLAQFAREHGLVSIVDNTLLTPVNFRPVELGFDLVIHSASKYLNGHADVVAGVVAGNEEQVEEVRKTLNVLGICLDPHACFLLHRGLKTLPVRVESHNAGATALAEALAAHEAVERVYYSGLRTDASFERASRWFRGHGGLLSFRVSGGVTRAEQLLTRLHYAHVAPSFGGIETLVCRPATTSHAGLPTELRKEMGIPEELIRVAVGLEDPDDLIADFYQAIDRSRVALAANHRF